MLAQVTAAAAAPELKTLAHPASADSIRPRRTKEDRRSTCDPLRTSAPLASVHALMRSPVPALDDDRPPSPDIAAITELIATGFLENASRNLVK